MSASGMMKSRSLKYSSIKTHTYLSFFSPVFLAIDPASHVFIFPNFHKYFLHLSDNRLNPHLFQIEIYS